MATEKEKIQKLEKEVIKLRKRLNHLSHRPGINAILDFVRKKGVTTIAEIRQSYHLYGGNLTKFYQALMDLGDEFAVVRGAGRGASMVVAYTPIDQLTFGQMAVKIFSETKRRGRIHIQDITKRFNLSEEDAKKVYNGIIELFKPRISYAKRHADLYTTPIKRLY